MFLLVSLQLCASEKRDKTVPAVIATLGSVPVSPDFIKPRMEKLNKAVLNRRIDQPVIQAPSSRKHSKRYRPASTAGLQKKLNWVFAY